jgi:imidazolonepropionase-like amidohydrolase
MKVRRAPVAVTLILVMWSLGAGAQSTSAAPQAAAKVTVLRCDALLDGKSGAARTGVDVVIEGEKIREVRAGASSAQAKSRSLGSAAQGAASLGMTSPEQLAGSEEVIEIHGTCLPGLIDTHTHVLLQGDITAADYDEQLLKMSTPYRAILGTVSARKALEYGFTTLRDLETEGAGYADVDIKKAINNGVIPGPRMFVAGRSMDVTGAYPLLGYSWELDMPHGVQVVDGVEAGRKAVREQLMNGADWIKVYSDRSYYVQKDAHGNTVLNDIPTFTVEELRAIVDEAHRQRHKVASHASALQGVHNSVEAGVDTVEHGQYIADEDLAAMKAKGVWYVPTLYVGEYVAEGRAKTGAKVWLDMVQIHADTFRRAVKAGVKIAFGTDAGGFDWNIDPAKEFGLMVKYGMTPQQALDAANMKAAELLGMADKLGSIEPGKFADIVAVPGDPMKDVGVLEKVNFVMKGGAVVKR